MDQSLNSVVARLQQLASLNGGDSVPDSELLRRYNSQRDPAALELLIWRYGSMVLATCRRLLGGGPDADDAFQATFLVLVRKAPGIRGRSLAAWLHRVACNACLRLRKRRALQSRSEFAAARPDRIGSAPEPTDWRPILDEEIARLPQRFRSAFLLCHLEGKTNDEAARLLGVPKGTLLSRLARARQRLKHRLIQRGIAPAACAAAFDAGLEPASASLVNSTLHVIGSQPSATPGAIAALAEGVIRDMNWIKLKLVACVFAAVALIGAGGIFLKQPDAQAEPDHPDKAPEKPRKPATDLDRLQGSWLITSLVINGRVQEESGVARMVIKGDVAGFIKRPGKKPDELKIKLDVTTTPQSINMSEGNDSMPGIYELNGDELRICVRERGNQRPKSFDAAKEGANIVLFVMKREKPEQKPAKDPDPGKPHPPATVGGPSPLDLLLPKKTLPTIPHDEYQMHGTWSVVAVTVDGQQRDPGEMQIAFGPFQTMTVRDPSLGIEDKPLSFKIDQESGAIDLTAGGKTQAGIYRLAHQGAGGSSELNGLLLCLNQKGDKRPTEFESAKGSGNVLFQMERRSYASDTKWGEKLFPDGLVLDFGKVAGNDPKTVQLRIKNPYPIPVWVSGGPGSGTMANEKWLIQKWPNRSGPIDPGQEITVEYVLYPGLLPSFGDSPFRPRHPIVPGETAPFVVYLKNYRPKTDPVPTRIRQSGSAASGQPESTVNLTIKADLGK